MLVFRTISGTIRNAQGVVAASRPVFFEPVSSFGSGGDIVPRKAIKCITDVNGFFTCQILTTDAPGGYARYKFTFPNGSSFLFDLIAGAPITIDELLNLSVTSETSTQAAFENAINDALAGLDPASFVTEIPSGPVNGSNAVFETAFDFVPETVKVFINGLRQKTPDEFQTSGTSEIHLAYSPAAGEIVQVDYLRS